MPIDLKKDKIKNSPQKIKKIPPKNTKRAFKKRDFFCIFGIIFVFLGDFCFIWGIYVLFAVLFVFFGGIFVFFVFFLYFLGFFSTS